MTVRGKFDPALFAAGLALIAGLAVLLLAAMVAAHAEWAVVAQEWEPYRLNESQRQWFKSVRPKAPGPACCDIADGHPTMADHRVDGWYIPNPKHTDIWVKVPEGAMTTPGTNPIGVATVWFGAYDVLEDRPYIRCFVPESET